MIELLLVRLECSESASLQHISDLRALHVLRRGRKIGGFKVSLNQRAIHETDIHDPYLISP